MLWLFTALGLGLIFLSSFHISPKLSYLPDNRRGCHWMMWQEQQWIILTAGYRCHCPVTSHFILPVSVDAARRTGDYDRDSIPGAQCQFSPSCYESEALSSHSICGCPLKDMESRHSHHKTRPWKCKSSAAHTDTATATRANNTQSTHYKKGMGLKAANRTNKILIGFDLFCKIA